MFASSLQTAQLALDICAAKVQTLQRSSCACQTASGSYQWHSNRCMRVSNSLTPLLSLVPLLNPDLSKRLAYRFHLRDFRCLEQRNHHAVDIFYMLRKCELSIKENSDLSSSIVRSPLSVQEQTTIVPQASKHVCLMDNMMLV